MTNYNNIFDMLTVMCDAAILIADGNWGEDTSVAEYVRSRIPNCQHVEGFRDILHPVIERRKKKAATVNEESTDRRDVAYNLFIKRDKEGLSNMRGQIHQELQVISENIYHASLDAKAAEILQFSEEFNKHQKDISANHGSKQDLEKLDNMLVKLINLL